MIAFSFSKILIILAAIIAIIVVYEICRVFYYIHISIGLVASAEPYTLSGSSNGLSVLVLGDSTAVGVGATTRQDSIPGRLAKYVGATRVENHAISGATVADVGSQLAQVEKKEYDYILLQIGANDMVAFHSLEIVSRDYEVLLKSLPKAKKLIVLSCGNLGGAKIFPKIMGIYYEAISRNYHAKFRTIVENHGGVYVDIFEEPSVDPFVLQPDVYLAKDYFHPSSVGYAHWFEKLIIQIKSIN